MLSVVAVRSEAKMAAVATAAKIVASHRRQPGSSPNALSRAATYRIPHATRAPHPSRATCGAESCPTPRTFAARETPSSATAE